MSELRATVRLQFHKDFTLDDAVPLVGYFSRLGISHIYASPLLTARAGSTHGYDVVDPTRINPELGGEEALERLVNELHAHDMGLIVDIVSNHMAVGGHSNPWWLDVMEWGPHSPYADFFDIQWQSQDPLMTMQILVPFLRSDYGEVLASGDIGLHFDAERGLFYSAHYEHHFPLYPPTYAELLQACDHPVLQELGRQFRGLSGNAGAWHTARQLRNQLAGAAQDAAVAQCIERVLQTYKPDDREGMMRLHRLLERQHYRLASWRTASDDINWRRFFDINELGGLRVENPRAFEASHATIFELIGKGWINGLRIDHVDGLANPRAYCRKLRRRISALLGSERSFPIFVEKILAHEEQLADDWGVDGTTGYEFMNEVSLLQHDPGGEEELSELWTQISGRPADFNEEVYEARKLVLASSLASDVETVARGLLQIARQHLETRDMTLGSIRRALTELVAHFPVYRTYAGACGRSVTDQQFFDVALAGAREDLFDSDWPVLEQISQWLGGEALRAVPPGPGRQLRRRILARFQQLTSPAAAKAVEDTACYRAGVLLSRYDVGYDPEHFSAPISHFHEQCIARQRRLPGNLLTTATHDNKRGEDTRARLVVLSERAAWYSALVHQWFEMAAPLRQELPEGIAPDPADEAILYQTLLGSWPMDAMQGDAQALQAYLERLIGWQEKALREAKLKSSWSAPNEQYEAACREFLSRLMTSDEAAQLRDSLSAAAAELAPAGALKSLTQTLLRMTVPGIPDLYQGREYWDFSLVDPDNRRSIDFDTRKASLSSGLTPPQLIEQWQNAHIKQYLIRSVLSVRRALSRVFSHGSYIALEAVGEYADRVVAFARCHESDYVIVIAPLHPSRLLTEHQVPHVPPQRWADTRLYLPPELRGKPLSGVFSSHAIEPLEGCILVSDALADFPVNVLCSTPNCQELLQ